VILFIRVVNLLIRWLSTANGDFGRLGMIEATSGQIIAMKMQSKDLWKCSAR